ncbi:MULTISPECIES: hypothetical protein [Acinetobacter]|uniref:Uncharacterized protein n=2 Tax=Acinetobacter TaxID=469 RepID=A0A6C0XZZ6_9GAMM|nr:hypothetical protein FHP22_11405 [Acinetobacter indicus]QIC69511.1 hypothetical protein FSC09_03375 [Acinetobacter indicus]QIC76718.1 hypothetical protein FSC17_09895 [Acinetobacter indicus]QIC79682.1 hypothetical protein FSC02_11380 [Acinetobacter indicus]QOW43544.1 hypothetical protein G0027_12280 [Acinetobacter indicus]
MMEVKAVELIQPLVLEKENCPPIHFETGTILKVLMTTPTAYLVTAGTEFNFTISFQDEHKVWRKL